MSRVSRSIIILLLAFILAACGAPVLPGTGEVVEEPIPGQYIVTMADSGVGRLSDAALDTAVARLSADFGFTRGMQLRVINAFVASGLDDADVAALRADPRVAHVEQDRLLQVDATTQSNPVWGLDRIDQRPLPLDKGFTYVGTGAGVTVYVVDTGIRSTHQEFEGRVLPGFTAINDGEGTEDCHSHGTHVAGTIGGRTYGVAKSVQLVPVRVMNCSGSGSISGVVAGLDWIAQHRRGPAVANLSIGGSTSTSLDNAVGKLVASGVTVVVSAGNSGDDACLQSPARVREAITVGATTSSDSRASYSNFGPCVDVFAPGSSIVSASHGSDTATSTKSGTSMAAPHTAGAAALVLGNVPSADPATVMRTLVDDATTGVLKSIGTGSPDRLLHAALRSDGSAGDPATEPEVEPEPEPTPEPVAPSGPPCTACEVYEGTLAAGGQVILPAGGYTVRTTGVHQGWLRGPSGADFDLVLERQNNGGRWSVVASSTGSTADEEIGFAGKSGTYRWRVVSNSGSGAFTLYLSLPTQ
jgi:aqualysin 1